MSIIGERRKYFKKEAKFFLRYNYIKQIFMTAVAILITFGLNAVKSNIMSLLRLDYGIYYAPLGILFDLFAFFITIPLYVGIIYVNTKLFEGETVPVAGMFHYFSSSANLTDCYRFIIAMTARLAAFAVPFLIFGAMLSKLREMFQVMLYGTIAVSVDIAMVCACIIYMSAFISCLVCFMRYFAAVFIFVKNPCLNMRDIIQKSAKLMKKSKIESLKLLMSFVVWIIISHYLAGFLYIFFTLPYIMLSYTSFLSYLLTEKGGSEFLSASGEYIDEIVAGRVNTVSAINAVSTENAVNQSEYVDKTGEIYTEYIEYTGDREEWDDYDDFDDFDDYCEEYQNYKDYENYRSPE